MLRESDIVNLPKGLYDRTVAAVMTSFFLRQNNLLKETIHWAQDFRRISRTPLLTGIINATEFCSAIEAARQRARIRKHSLEESASLSNSANPGKLKQHKDWITWSRALNNYM